MAREIIEHPPGAILDYPVDWTAFLALEGPDAIATGTLTVADGMVVSDVSHTATEVRGTFSGGVEGGFYEAKCEITTTGGRASSHRFTFLVTHPSR